MSSSSQQNPNRYVNDLNRLKAQRSGITFFCSLVSIFYCHYFLSHRWGIWKLKSESSGRKSNYAGG